MSLSCIDYVNQAPGLALIKSKNSEILASSPQMTELLGFKSVNELSGLTDRDLRCDANKGADQFVTQDQIALSNGECKAIDIYKYANGELKIIYHEKKALKINHELFGLSFSGYELTQLHQIANQFFSLLDNDQRFLKLDQSKATSYCFQDTYPDGNCNAPT